MQGSPVSLHLIKLCVGADSVRDLEDWIADRLADQRRRHRPVEHAHVTRMTPRRKDELLAGGSLYWVIRGFIQVRQPILDIQPVMDDEGLTRCRIVLDPALVPTEWQPRRPFQGWRYLEASDVPPDLGEGGGVNELPPHMKAELAMLGLL